MKKLILPILFTFCFVFGIGNHGYAQNPDYEKYGKIAITVVVADYPGDPVRDYEYLGRKKLSENTVEDSFRFQVEEKNEKFFVTVKVKHNLTNNKLQTITVESQKQ